MPRSSDPARVQLWIERFERQRLAAITVAQFCEREAITVSNFYFWKKKLTRVAQSNTLIKPEFLSVQIKATSQVAAVIRLRGDVAIEVQLGVDRYPLTELLVACIDASEQSAEVSR